jgi:cathepsin D
MLCQASLLFAATLALSASASPALNRAAGVSIPLARRSGVTTSDGLFDRDEAIRKSVFAMNKHRQNLINLERNQGRDAFNEASDSSSIPDSHLTNLC